MQFISERGYCSDKPECVFGCYRNHCSLSDWKCCSFRPEYAKAIENQIRSQLQAIPSIPSEAISRMVQDITNQPKTKALIAHASQKALNFIINDNEISKLIDMKTQKERNIEYLRLKVSEIQHRVENLNSLISKAQSLNKNNQQDIGGKLEKIQNKHHKIQERPSTELTEAIQPIIQKTDACIADLNKIASQTAKDASNPTSTLDLNQKSAEINRVVSTHTASTEINFTAATSDESHMTLNNINKTE